MNLISAFRLSLDPTDPDVIALVGAGGKTSTLFRLSNEIVAAGKRVVTTTTTRIFGEQIAQSPVHLWVRDGRVDWTQLDQLLAQHGQCLLVTAIEGPKALGLDVTVVDDLARRAADLGIVAILNEADGSRRHPLKAPAPHEPVIPDSTTLLAPVMGLDALGLAIDEEHVHRPERVRSVLGLHGDDARVTPQMAAQLLVDPQGGVKDKPGGARLLPLLNKADTAPRLASGRLVARMLAARGQASLIGTVGLADGAPIRERWGATTAVVLAAGESRRMGEAKQLLELAGEPLVVHAARTALRSGASEVIVVSGAHAEGVQTALASLMASSVGRLRLIQNAAWSEGQSTSVRAAVDAVSPDCQAVLFLPVDQPNVPVSLLRTLWHCWRTGADLAAPTVAGELRGAPALFDRTYWPDLRCLSGDQGGRPLLKKHSAGVATIATPAHWLEDVDTPSQWAQFRTEGRDGRA